MKPETIQAVTPLFLSSIAAILGLAVIFSPNLSDAKWAAALGLAGSAIGGASGLAQSNKGDRISLQKDTQNSIQEEP